MRRTLFLGFLAAVGIAWPQSTILTCSTAAVPTIVRGEGVAERMGDVVLRCGGAAPGSLITGNLTVFLSVTLTNKRSASGAADIILTVDTGAGPVQLPPPVYVSQNSAVFLGISFTASAGTATLRISNVRGNANQLGVGSLSPIQVTVAGGAALAVNASQLIVGYPVRGLLAAYASSGVRCTGSALPAIITLTNLFATGTRFFSTRITEGHAEVFQKKDPLSDTGTRIVSRLSGFPIGARLFVLDVVAGSNATFPTSGGDLGLPQHGGRYTPDNAGSLLLARVFNHDSNGAGGFPYYNPLPPGSGSVSFDTVTELTLTGGAATLVYEVVDGNPSVRESAQFPIFLGLLPGSADVGAVAQQELSLGPISVSSIATTTDPTPRYAAIAPELDCNSLGDCNASYFPRLEVTGLPPQFSAIQNSAPQVKYLQIQNSGGGLLNWTAGVVYKSGSGWLRIEPDSGLGSGTIRLDATPGQLAPGLYEATLVIDGGPFAGTKSVPVALLITAFPPPPPPPATPKVGITAIGNAARPDLATLAPGARARIDGFGFGGQSVTVTFDGFAARLLTVETSIIHLEVPLLLSGRTSAVVEVIVDGERSATRTVPLAEVAPAIYPGGVLNTDYSVNRAASPAPVGSILQIFATGVLAQLPGQIRVQLHDRFPMPLYAGPAPGLIGIDQINVPIPDDLPAMQSEVLVCGFASAAPGVPVCSRPATIWLSRPE